ncbi:hypothetical protein [Microbacterium hatanonis]|uniref:Apea-like HEPN domain-containing protein n=1 Tax=Microbacterium hatanonis TaxID=404366 RepID=A0A5C8I0C2_9MICO|nr:hypothetical protein [Microbacterium hatanonis]TXK12357.1 hypothetical protein FVP77_02440 [Microbacterium hatanonis]
MADDFVSALSVGLGADPAKGPWSNVPKSDIAVIEVRAVFPEDAPSDDAISEAFSEGLGMIQQLQRAYYLATGDSVQLVAREALPAAIPFARNTPEAGEAVDVGMYLTHGPALRRDTLSAVLTDDQLTAIRTALRGSIPFWPVADLRREAEAALELRGDYRGAVLASATSAEVLLDTILLHLLWTDGVQASEAANLFTETGLATRVKTQYHIRIKGDWDVTGSGAVADWYRHTALLRHRVVHAGYRPSRAEAVLSLQSAYALERFIGDLLAAPGTLAKYLKTALAFVGVPGLTRRNVLSKRIRGMLDALPSDPHAAYIAWETSMPPRM